jgi:glycosyltransferase involved in cell wall biosynthesis
VVIPSGYPVDDFAPRPSQGVRFRSEHGIPADALAFGLAARFAPQKDHANLLKAFSLFLKAAPGVDACLLLAGRDLDANNDVLAGMIRHLGIQERVRLLGLLEDVPSFMNALDFHVLSSSHGEAFPNVVCESMACAVPNIATDVGDVPTIMGDTGWIVEPRNAEALCRAMLEAQAEELPARAQRGMASRERIVHNFSVETAAGRYLAVWQQRQVPTESA